MTKIFKPAITVDLKRPLIRIHKDTLHMLGDPEYILLLVNPKDKTIAILPSDKSDVKAHHISKSSLLHNKSFELYSTNLIKNLLSLSANWQAEKTYRINGIQVLGQNIIKFKMSDAVTNL